LVVNRSPERARELAGRWDAEVVSWSDLEDALVIPDMVVSSIGAEEAVLGKPAIERAMLARENRALFLIDLGVPRNIAPDAGKLYNVYLYNVDDLVEIVEQNKRARAGEIPRVEGIIDEHIAKFQAWQAGVEITAVLRDLRAKLGAEREAFLRERLAGAENLSAGERERIGKLADEMLEKLVINPVARLRDSRELRRRVADLEAVRRLFGLDQEKQ
jgi:glutamyl-tRNA reductase